VADRERAAPPPSGDGGGSDNPLRQLWARIERGIGPWARRLEERPQLRRNSWRVLVVVLAFIGAALGLTLAGSVTRSVGPVHAKFGVRPSASMQGGTSINIPPLGSLRLDTNRGPVQLNVTVTDINTRAAQRLINDPSQIKGIEKRVTRDVNTALAELVVRAALAALVGAAVLTFVVTRRWKAAVAGVVVIVLAELATGGAAYLTRNSKALAEPKYTGLLSRAPAMIGNVQDIVERFGKYSTELAHLVTNVSKLYAVTSTLPQFGPTDDTIRVLHVSDIHDNPEAWDVIASISKQFDVDFVIDTGDLTDHGTAAENAVANGIAGLDKPYVFIKGNHDSEVTLDAVRAQPNAIVLSYSAAVVDGLRIYGAPDPRFTPDVATADSAEDEKAIGDVGEQLKTWVQEAMPPPIDIVMVHDPVEGKALDGVVPLVLAGHLHKREVDQLKQGTVILVEGSTGGAGLRALDHDEPTPLDASVLYFSRTTKKLQAYDDITLGGLGLTSVNVVRHIVTKPSASPSPSPSGVSSPAASGSAVASGRGG
jgi:predicted MPP superfamily phosphohydrolase